MKVEQSDREAWIAYEDFDSAFAERVRAGAYDSTSGLVAFAAHREAERERCAELASQACVGVALSKRRSGVDYSDAVVAAIRQPSSELAPDLRSLGSPDSRERPAPLRSNEGGGS